MSLYRNNPEVLQYAVYKQLRHETSELAMSVGDGSYSNLILPMNDLFFFVCRQTTLLLLLLLLTHTA